MKNFTQKFTGLLVFVFTINNAFAQCQDGNYWDLSLTDSYGDGWNGATLSISDCDGNLLVAGISLNSGGAYMVDVCLPISDGYVIDAGGGTYDNEISWTLLDENGSIYLQGEDETVSSCEVPGCTNDDYVEFNPAANTDDGSCSTLHIYGCTDPNYLEYDENANTDDGSCFCVSSVEITVTTTSEEPFEAVASVVGDYHSAVTGEDLMFIHQYYSQDAYFCLAVGDPIACDELANKLNDNPDNAPYNAGIVFTGEDLMAITDAHPHYANMCIIAPPMQDAAQHQWVCDDLANYINQMANEYQYLELPLFGSFGGNNYYWSSGNGGSSGGKEFIVSTPGEYTFSLSQTGCETLYQDFVVGGVEVLGCTNSSAVNYNEEANSDDGSCIIEGCTDEQALNYNEQATENDGSCVAVINGCMDETAFNYDSDANTDDGSCVDIVEGCMEETAFNYNAEANTDDGSCLAVVNGCMDSSMSNYNSEANTEDGSCVSWEELANSLQSELDNVVPEDGVSQEDVDAAYVAGAASVELPECEEVATQNMPLDLPQGWSMFGYTCLESLDIIEAFSDISDNIEIVKDEWGLAYLPAWGFSAFNNLEFGEGYQIKMVEAITDFQFCTTIAGGASQEELDAAIAEVHAMYEGWCESDIDNDGVCDSDEVSGCMDASSCNYVSEAEFDDGSCDYESCLDECGVINGDNSSCTDACGVINGDNSTCMDECGVPNGDNSSCTDDCATDICLFLTSDGRLTYYSNSNILGFQFHFPETVLASSGDDAAEAGFMISSSSLSSFVLGISFTGNSIPAGYGHLLDLTFGVDSPLCPSDIVISGAGGASLSFSMSCEF